MKFTIPEYIEYYKKVAAIIGSKGEYITALDSAIADGDHWLNLNNGFTKLMNIIDDLAKFEDFQSFFMNLARNVVACMGGTSGALYCGMYLASAKKLGKITEMGINDFADMFECWSQSIMEKGGTKPGQKTMLDSIYPASVAFREALNAGKSEKECLEILKKAAEKGAEDTKDMEAARGRASNMAGKGVGHLDPGAVTMSYQIIALADCLLEK